MRLRGLTLFTLLLFLVGCTGQELSGRQDSERQVELLVSAAASLSESLTEIKTAYESENPDVRIILNVAGSGTLQQQIEQGAQADLFLSAGEKQMDSLLGKKLIEPDFHTMLLSNELVMITQADTTLHIDQLLDITRPTYKKIAVGEPETVPAGSYTKAALTHYKLWDKLENKLVYAKDVRQVLTYVETGNAELGFVYKTDAMATDKVQISIVMDPQSYPTIRYPMGIIKGTRHPEEAQAFFHYLLSEAAQEHFEAYGFTSPQP